MRGLAFHLRVDDTSIPASFH